MKKADITYGGANTSITMTKNQFVSISKDNIKIIKINYGSFYHGNDDDGQTGNYFNYATSYNPNIKPLIFIWAESFLNYYNGWKTRYDTSYPYNKMALTLDIYSEGFNVSGGFGEACESGSIYYLAISNDRV